MKKIPRKFLWEFNFHSFHKFLWKFNFHSFHFIKIIIIFIILLVLVMAAWFLWGGDYFKQFQKQQEIRSRVSGKNIPGYAEENIKTTEGETAVEYKISGHQKEDIDRVVNNVTVRAVDFPTPEEAQKPITDASLVYIWEWRTEKIGGRDVKAGYLRNREQTTYEAAYIGWVEGSTYFELISRPKEIKDSSDKEFLWQSTREVAESIIKKGE